MRHRSPHTEGSAGAVGSRPPESIASYLTEWAASLDLVPRLQAIVDELDLLDADVDVPRTLAAGLLEDLEGAT
jgi:hypothetical protein